MFTLLALVGIALIPTPASAIVIPPGGFDPSPLPAGTVASSGFLNTSTGTIANGDLNVTLRTAVYVDSVTGKLDFAYQASVLNGSANLDRLTATSFKGFVTDYYCDMAPTGSFWDNTSTIVGSTSAARTPSGAQVTANFDSLGSGIVGPGQATCVLIIKTDATNYQAGIFQGINGGVVQIASFAPGPEPSSMAIAGLGALGLIGYGIRRRRGA